MATMFLSGVTAAMFLVAAIFFLKFWRASRNRFFALFAVACALFSLERVLSMIVFVTLTPEIYKALEARGWVYILRLAGFGVITGAIIDRNRTKHAAIKRHRAPR